MSTTERKKDVKKRGPGRPRKSPEGEQKKQVHCALPLDLHIECSVASARQGITLTDFVRDALERRVNYLNKRNES